VLYAWVMTRLGDDRAAVRVSASVAHAFGVLGASDLCASVLSTDAASRQVLEKAGLSVHREIDHGDHVEVIYRITR
jgi:RimJ/RimL family protein N-acetyltransferase